MKCKSCNANYGSGELYCPYCGTENPRGRLWKNQRIHAEVDAQVVQAGAAMDLRRAKKHRAINRTLVVELVLTVLLSIALLILTAVNTANTTPVDPETLYTEERFVELRVFLRENDRYDRTEYDEYRQMVKIYEQYRKFCLARIEFFTETDRGHLGEYTAENLAKQMNEVLAMETSIYGDITDRNRVIWEKYCRDVEVFAVSVLGFTESDMEMLHGEIMPWEDAVALAQVILEGRCWGDE